MMSEVSVIMNSVGEDESYFHQAVTSILDQQHVKIHLILNTLEGDHSVDLIKSHSGDIQINALPREGHPGRNPEGSFYQLNKALTHIRGEWFIFASSNCVLSPYKYIMEIEAANEKGGYMGYSNFRKVDSNLNHIQDCVFGAYDHDRHLRSNFIPDQSVINMQRLSKYLPFSVRWYNMGFWDFWLRVYEGEGDVFGYYDNFTRLYRQDNKQMHLSLNDRTKRLNAQTEMLKTHRHESR